MTFEPRKKLRIIVLVHEDLVPPDSLNGLSDKEKLEVKTEFDVISTLKKMGHEVYPDRSVQPAQRDRKRAAGTQASHRFQPARRVSRLSALRSARRQLSRTDEAGLHRL